MSNQMSAYSLPGIITQYDFETESPLQYLPDGEKQMKFLETFCYYEHISLNELYSRCRVNKLVAARQVSMWLFDKIFKGCTLKEIGQVFCRDHSTILYAKKTIDGYLTWDKNLQEKIKFYKHLFKIK